MDINKNHGFIEVPLARTDFVVGSDKALGYEVINSNGKWENYLPEEEKQHSDTYAFDSAGCVSFSANNTIETQLKYFYNRLPATHQMFLEDYMENDEVNLSDRFLAKMSGTLKTGNYAVKVADTLRHYGAVPETMWDWDTSQDWNWDSFYAEIPDEVKAKGMEFLNYFDIAYEWVHMRWTSDQEINKIRENLKHAPLQIMIATCKVWSKDDPVQWCGREPNHAIMLHGLKDDGTWQTYDTYNPYVKNLANNYVVPWVFKIVITPKTNMLTVFRYADKPTEVYVTGGTTKNHIANYYTLSQGARDGLWDWNEGDTIPVSENYSKLPEGAEIVLSPADNM